MAIENSKRVWIPASCAPEVSQLLETLIAESYAWVTHGRRGGKRPSAPKLPRTWADAAIDCNAYGFLAIPRSIKALNGVLDLRELDPKLVLHYAVPEDQELIRCISVMRATGGAPNAWALGFECRKRAIKTLTLIPSEGQRSWLHMLFNDMLKWQQYFIKWHRIPIPYRRLPAWAMRRLWRDDFNVWPTTIRALQLLGDTRRYPKGVHSLIFRNPSCGERYLDLDPVGRLTVDGTIKIKPVTALVNYCKEEDKFTVQLREKDEYQD